LYAKIYAMSRNLSDPIRVVNEPILRLKNQIKMIISLRPDRPEGLLRLVR
jgi:hypothetical protein